jgi:hypothetical protein
LNTLIQAVYNPAFSTQQNDQRIPHARIRFDENYTTFIAFLLNPAFPARIHLLLPSQAVGGMLTAWHRLTIRENT